MQFNLVTSDDLREGHLRLRTMLRYVTDPNHVDSQAAFAFILGILRRKGIKWKCHCFVFDLTCDITGDPGANFLTLSERTRPGLSIAG